MNSCFFCRNIRYGSHGDECRFDSGRRIQWHHLHLRRNKDRDDSEIFQDVAEECERFILNREQVLRGLNCKTLEEF
jgi:hypothetical protein